MWDAFICACWLAGAGEDARTSPVLYGLCGGLRLFILMAEGRSFGAAAGGRKGPRKRRIFPKSDALLDIGVLTREKKGEKRCESDASLGMHHFHAKSARKCGCSRLVVCRRCTDFAQVYSTEREGNAPSQAASRCIRKFASKLGSPISTHQILFFGGEKRAGGDIEILLQSSLCIQTCPQIHSRVRMGAGFWAHSGSSTGHGR